MASLGCLTLLALGAAGGWLYREEIRGWWLTRGPEPVAAGPAGRSPAPPTPPPDELRPTAPAGRPVDPGADEGAASAPGAETARADGAGAEDTVETGDALDAEGRLRVFLAGPGPAEIRLTEAELRDLVGRRLVPVLPAGIWDPAVSLEDSALVASASLDVARVLGGSAPPMIVRMVGDSTRVTADLVPRVRSPGVLLLRVRRLRAGRLELPAAVVPWLAGELGLGVDPDDPRTLRIPAGGDLRAARVREGALTLTRGGEPEG